MPHLRYPDVPLQVRLRETVNGVAVFDNLASTTWYRYTLVASASGVASPSRSFNIFAHYFGVINSKTGPGSSSAIITRMTPGTQHELHIPPR